MLLQTSSETTALSYKLMQDNTQSQKACILEQVDRTPSVLMTQ